ncbi:hypothetical protein PV327_007338 [Microctonus hyperodae]|uniref:G-protein coupled receptors family 1 profile domain-containing protein n=1 Tax=Microctonus hyperodae TaxID=165561 RepID=A0AA39F692_MICHY|nr:hypothetical protein PV327_007338 [Microctonus hyperodae]
MDIHSGFCTLLLVVVRSLCSLVYQAISSPSSHFFVPRRNATAIFIMNLSISDLMFCCFNLPLATSTFWYSSWRHGPLLCKLFPLLRYGLVAVSLFTVLAITINRYIMIGHPRLYPKLYKPKYLIMMVVATWVFGFGALVMTWLEEWGRFGLDPDIGSCSILPDINGHSPKEFLFILAFLTPCVAIIVCYARIFYIVRKTAYKSRRHEKLTTDLIKATLQAKFKKNGEDSAIGSSCGVTVTTENCGSPIKNDRVQSHQISSPYRFMTDPKENIDMSLNNGKINFRNEKRMINVLKMDNISKRNEESSSIDVADNVQVLTINSNSINIQDENLEEYTSILKLSNTNRETEILSSITIPNFKLSKVNLTNKKLLKMEVKEQILNSSTLANTEKCLQIPEIILKNFEHCSQHPLALPLTHYDTSEVSEEFVSLRSDSVADKTTRKNIIFKRESRFRSIKNRGIETGKMTAKDRKLLKMILVIFSSFLICYLPITITKIFKDNMIDWRGLNIIGYILIYLTTCINPIIYVVMSSEYRSAYKNVLLCRNDSNVFKGIRRTN